MNIGVFIPTYNVESTIGQVLERIPGAARARVKKIYVVDNVSSDSTLEVVKAYLKSHPSPNVEVYRNQGNFLLGGSTVMAFELALRDSLDYLICLHSDGQAAPEALTQFIEYCEEDRYDFILGSRLLSASDCKDYSLHRRYANLAFAYIQQLILGQRIYDIGAYIAFNMRCVAKLPFRSIDPDMGYQPTLTLTAARLSRTPLLFFEFPIAWGKVESSNVNIISYGLKHLSRLFKIGLGRINLDNNFAKDMKTDLVFRG